MDIRGRCDPVLHPNQFSKCPCRVNTTYFHLLNTYEEYQRFCLEKTNRRDRRNKEIKKIAKEDKYKLTPDECEELLELFEEEDEEDGDYDCVCCGDYIPIDEEDRAEGDGDCRLVCGDCAPITICAECGDFNQNHDYEPYEDVDGKFLCECCREEDETDNEEDE